MPRDGRLSPFIPLLYFYATISITASLEYGVPIEIKLWDTGRTPLAHMVDVTNGFGLKVLAEHNFLNDNNIAFSPYGLMGIIVALYEGIDGESSYQIQRGMQLPWNRNVMRIGFRDIHRTLKTYFVPEEGFLAGLALNNENVTFNKGYRNILRFYGFELENDQLPTLTPNNGTNETSLPPTMSADEPTRDITTATPTSTETMPAREDVSTTQEMTTLNPNAETINEVDIRVPTTPASPSLAPNAEPTSTPGSTVADTVTEYTQSITPLIMMNGTLETTTAVPTETIPAPVATDTTTDTSNDMETSTQQNVGITNVESSPFDAITIPQTTVLTGETTMNNEIETLTTAMEIESDASTEATMMTTTAVPTDRTETESVSVMSSTPETEKFTSTFSSNTATTQDPTTPSVNESTLEILERRKRSIVDFIFTSPPYVDDYLFYRSFDIGPELPTNEFNGDKMFLVNGLRNVQVTYMHYDTILEHAYLPHLEAAALRLPLDSERYYLLVVLPTRGGPVELGRLLGRMARESDLSDVYSALRPRRVRAIVPSFTVKGHITLTTDLQKLGIRDVFEPRQRDFMPMTSQQGVYVRSIEQAVSVAIRKYRPDDQKKNRYVINRQPVKFSATYPFLYFVMDSNIHVSLMAGKMVDPLNTRIL